MKAFDVYIDRKISHPTTGAIVGPGLIDTVFCNKFDTIQEVKTSLINHDGYPGDIIVVDN